MVCVAACGGEPPAGDDTGAVRAADAGDRVPRQVCEPGTRWCEENDTMECTADGLSAWRTPCEPYLCFEGACCLRMCSGRSCGDDGCGGVCGECGPYLACDEATWECGPPCAEELFSAEVCGSGLTVQPSCGACTSDGAGALCIREEEDAQGVVQTWCECNGEEEGFHCTWKRTIPGQTDCMMDSDCPEGFCSSGCHPHAPPYCTTNCTSHTDCPEGTYCGDNVSVDFWEEVDDWPPHHAPRCIPDGHLGCGGCDPAHPRDGCPCETDADCSADGWGFCLPARHGRMCSVSRCVGECVQSLSCAQIHISGGDPGPVFSCVDPNIIEGMPCRSNAACVFPWMPDGARSCVVQGDGGAFCVAAHPPGHSLSPATCLTGGACASLAPGPIPGDFLECPWYHVEMEAATDCAVSNEHGTCLGERRCTASGLTDCDAPTPAEEVCDDVDNDCDGETDEGC